jgi:tyrosyl-tRNA synthetase
VWLDPGRTSPFRFYQFWFNTDDRDVIRYLKYFTFRSQVEIADLERVTQKEPQRRAAQRQLARDVTEMVHGKNELKEAEKTTAALFGLQQAGGVPPYSGDDSPAIKAWKEIGEDLTSGVTLEARLFPNGIAAVDLAMRAGLVTSKSEATRLIQQGGLYLDDERLSNPRVTIGPELLTPGRMFKLRKGQRERRLVRIE